MQLAVLPAGGAFKMTRKDSMDSSMEAALLLANVAEIASMEMNRRSPTPEKSGSRPLSEKPRLGKLAISPVPSSMIRVRPISPIPSSTVVVPGQKPLPSVCIPLAAPLGLPTSTHVHQMLRYSLKRQQEQPVRSPHANKKRRLKVKAVLPSGFDWKDYPELESYMMSRYDDYSRFTKSPQQRSFHNQLTQGLLDEVGRCGYILDPSISFLALGAHIRNFYKHKSSQETARPKESSSE